MNTNLGAIYTPPDFAKLIADWAIQKTTDTILDLGVGEGVFVHAAYQRLIEVGATPDIAQKNIYGSEINPLAFDEFVKESQRKNISFENIKCEDFFTLELPPINVVIGNPPYVRRSNLDNTDHVRRIISDLGFEGDNISRLSDLYIYFLLRSFSALVAGGRIAVITADSWMNVGYGQFLRNYLLQEFVIEKIVTIDRRIFEDADVKPAMLFAYKRPVRKSVHFDFLRVRNGLPAKHVFAHIKNPELQHEDIERNRVKQSNLKGDYPWSIHIKAPDTYRRIATHQLTKPVSDLAKTQIGHQTLAKDFFVLTPEIIDRWQLESEFVRPLAHSAKFLRHPIITKDQEPEYYLFYCSKAKSELIGTNALKYIENAELLEVAIRGKNKTVVGFQNKERIQKASRANWYDLQTRLVKRGTSSIIIPRLVYKTYIVYWNQALYESGELFIEFRPFLTESTEIYLAILNSTVTEIVFRVHAQLYGGGTYNMNSGAIKSVPILDAGLLNVQQKSGLVSAYRHFLQTNGQDRSQIDDVIFDILGFENEAREQCHTVLKELILMATSSKKS